MNLGILSFLACASFMAMPLMAQETDTDIQKLTTKNADFASILYRNIAGYSDDNVFFSPLCVSLSLAALASGAVGSTRQELLQATSLSPLDQGDQRIPELFQKLLGSVTQNGALRLDQAIGLFSQVQVDEAFIKQAKTFFDTNVQTVDFGNNQATKTAIDNFVNAKTGNKVTEVVSTLDPKTKILLINAIFFQGQWELPFNANLTQEERFYIDKYHVITTPMMFRSDKYYLAYDRSLKVGILRLPLSGGASMLVILPDEGVDYTSVDEEITAERYLGWLKQLKKTKLEVQMPKFLLEQTYSLKKILPNIGFNNIFQDTADLTSISTEPGLKLTEMIHKAAIAVDERSNGAAASINFSNLPPRLTINRPFLFLIYHEATSSLLFMGRVIDPSKK